MQLSLFSDSMPLVIILKTGFRLTIKEGIRISVLSYTYLHFPARGYVFRVLLIAFIRLCICLLYCIHIYYFWTWLILYLVLFYIYSFRKIDEALFIHFAAYFNFTPSSFFIPFKSCVTIHLQVIAGEVVRLSCSACVPPSCFAEVLN